MNSIRPDLPAGPYVIKHGRKKMILVNPWSHQEVHVYVEDQSVNFMHSIIDRLKIVVTDKMLSRRECESILIEWIKKVGPVEAGKVWFECPFYP